MISAEVKNRVFNDLRKIILDGITAYSETGTAYHMGEQTTVDYLIESAVNVAMDKATGTEHKQSTRRTAALANLSILINNYANKKVTADDIKVIRQELINTAAAVGDEQLIVRLCAEVMALLTE